MIRGRYKMVEKIKRMRSGGYTVEAIAHEFNTSRDIIARILKGEEPEDWQPMTITERMGLQLLRRPDISLKTVFFGDFERYRQCVIANFGAIE